MTKYLLFGQAGQVVDCVTHEKLRAVFAMFDETKTQIAWYIFAAKADAATQRACTAKFPGAAFGLWGFRDSLGAFIPFNPKKAIPLDGLAGPFPKGARAMLDLALPTPPHTVIDCSLSGLKTKAGETVSLSFEVQQSSKPARTKSIEGLLYFLELAKFSDKALINGPQTKKSQSFINGGVL